MVTPTSAQRRIRDHQSLDLLALAPAGCGKTEALALRVAGLIDRKEIRAPQRVLVTTFSNRARDNIRDRLASYLPPAVRRDRVTVVNFHGLSARIYRAHAKVIGMSPDLLIPDSDWVGEQCRSRRLSFNMISTVRDTLRIAKQNAADDTEVERLLAESDHDVVVEIEQLRRAQNRLTYDDLPRLAELILANDTVAQLYRHHFAAVIVDEFQDLTPQQLRLVNRIGYKKTTYAGDLAQGIYGFAGAEPEEIDRAVRAECGLNVIEFSESHRSSPAVLNVVNALTPRTGGTLLTSADPASWPGGGLAAHAAFSDADSEAQWVIDFTKFVLTSAPNHRVAIIARTNPRRRFVDTFMEQSGLPFHRWDDGVLDTDTARIVKAMLARFDFARYQNAEDKLAYLRQVADLEALQDPSSREALAGALNWCYDLLDEGFSLTAIRARVRIGDQNTLINVPGVHLLTGHVGKGQQFDWVVIIGAEEGCIPDFRADTQEAVLEEARVLSVMVSRARHGVLVLQPDFSDHFDLMGHG
ncbi:UvrD-helicase domain-containing protein [Parafrankia sp. FMc2]|uniref:UvrD-helicase domain-containing protein n=1 Tax=Parafrankia sp. FMc2 TaxID=3233196 RepID=UPI0034D7381C